MLATNSDTFEKAINIAMGVEAAAKDHGGGVGVFYDNSYPRGSWGTSPRGHYRGHNIFRGSNNYRGSNNHGGNNYYIGVAG